MTNTRKRNTRVAHLRMLLPVLGALAAAGCGTGHFGLAGAPPRETGWAAALVGSWAFVDGRESSLREPAALGDTAVWHLEPSGQLRHSRIHVRMRAGVAVAEESDIGSARWWVEAREVDGRTAEILCTSARPGRGSQCGRITIDTVSIAGAPSKERLRWSGVTFKSQRWVFLKRGE